MAQTPGQVCAAVADELPDIPLHAWGLSLRTLRSPVMLPSQVISCDSSSWNWRYGHDLEECRPYGLSVRQWAITVALPRFQPAVEDGWSIPKQLALPWQPERLIDHHRKRRSRATWLRQDRDGVFFGQFLGKVVKSAALRAFYQQDHPRKPAAFPWQNLACVNQR